MQGNLSPSKFANLNSAAKVGQEPLGAASSKQTNMFDPLPPEQPKPSIMEVQAQINKENQE